MGLRLARAGVAFGLIAGAGGYAAYEISQDPSTFITPADPSELPPEVPIIYDMASYVCDATVSLETCGKDTMLGSISSGGRLPTGISGIPDFARKALVASEDRNFYKHHGVDGKATIRAAGNNIIASVGNLSVQMNEGASTITMQDGRWRWGLDQASSLSDKQREASLAMGLELALEPACAEMLGFAPDLSAYPIEQYSLLRKCVKDQILADYFERVYFGRGAYGFGMAALQYFNKQAIELSEAETIFILAPINAPSDMDFVANNPERLALELDKHRQRYSVIVNDMLDNNDIDKEKAISLHDEYDQVLARLAPYIPRGGIHTEPAKKIAAEHATVRAIEEAAAKTGRSVEDISQGGYRIITSIDPQAQAVAGDLARYTAINDQGYELAMTAIAKDGGVIAMVGGLNRSESKVNLATGVAGGGSGRNLGSSTKTIILAAAIERGRSADDILRVESSYTMPKADNGKDYIIDTGNGCNILFGTPPPCDMTLEQALEVSSNVAFGQLIGETGEAPAYGSERVYEILREAGSDIQGDPVASVVTGSGDSSVYSQAVVHAGLFLNEGKKIEPYLVSKVYGPNGALIYDRANDPAAIPGPAVLTPEVAVETLQALRAPVEGSHGTARRIKQEHSTPNNTVGPKTGTAPNNTDFWTTGIASDNETGGVAYSFWVGNPDKPTRIEGLSSGDVAAIAGSFIVGMGAANDGSQLPTEPTGA